MMNSYVLTGAKVVSGDHIGDYQVAVKNGKIVAVDNDLSSEFSSLPHIALQSTDVIVPGFIDIHIHGSQGADVMDGSVEALEVISQSIYTQGVTGYLATTMTCAVSDIDRSMQAIAAYHQQSRQGANILGVHLEGPFISANKIGAQNPNYLHGADAHLLDQWHRLSGGALKKVTLAPEIEGCDALIGWCKHHGVVGSIGHSNCTAHQALQAIEKGCTQATHLFNAMSGVDHRRPGVAAAFLMSKNLLSELIVDGVHLAGDTVRMTYKILGADQIVLVTDAMSAQAKGEGLFKLGGQNVIVKNGEARLENGTIAGSVLQMNKAFENMLNTTKANWVDMVKMTSHNAAKSLGLGSSKGQIKVGYDADIVVLDQYYQVKHTFKA